MRFEQTTFPTSIKKTHMAKRRKKISNQLIASTFAKKGCNVSATCIALGIDRSTFYDWRNNDPKLNKMLNDESESIIDYTESKLLEKIQEGDLTAIIFMLKTRGKNRGYIERVENNISVTPFENLMMSLPDDDDD
jgi:hypothetical protein